MKIRNVNDYGRVDMPLIGREGEPHGVEGVGALEYGETVDVSPEHARILLQQVGNYAAADREAAAVVADLAAQAQAVEDAHELAQMVQAVTTAPLVSAPKALWVAWATRQGQSDAASMTKAALVAAYGHVAPVAVPDGDFATDVQGAELTYTSADPDDMQQAAAADGWDVDHDAEHDGSKGEGE